MKLSVKSFGKRVLIRDLISGKQEHLTQDQFGYYYKKEDIYYNSLTSFIDEKFGYIELNEVCF